MTLSMRTGLRTLVMAGAVLAVAGCEVRAGADGDFSLGIWQGSAEAIVDSALGAILLGNDEPRAEGIHRWQRFAPTTGG